MTVLYNLTTHDVIYKSLSEAYGVTLIAHFHNNIGEYIDAVSNVRDRIFLTSQKNFISHALIVLGATVAICSLSMGIIPLLKCLHVVGKPVKKISNDELEDL